MYIALKSNINLCLFYVLYQITISNKKKDNETSITLPTCGEPLLHTLSTTSLNTPTIETTSNNKIGQSKSYHGSIVSLLHENTCELHNETITKRIESLLHRKNHHTICTCSNNKSHCDDLLNMTANNTISSSCEQLPTDVSDACDWWPIHKSNR